MKAVAVLPQEGFVRLKTVLTVYPVSESHWNRGVKSGQYPRPVRLGNRIVAWKASDIRAVIDGTWQPVAPTTATKTGRAK